MSDPLRWTDPESEATTLERVLIQGEAQSGPSERVVSGVWTKLSATLPPLAVGAGAAAGGGGLGAAAAAKAAQAGAVTKGAVGGSAGFSVAALAKPLILGIVLGGGSVVVSQEVKQITHDPPPVTAPTKPAQQRQGASPGPLPVKANGVPAPAANPVSDEPPTRKRGSASAAGAGAVAEAPAREPQSRESQLAAERKRLVEARALLRAGRASECLALLDSNPGVGLLGQERLVIRVEALMTLGRKAEAKQLADRLITKHPESPYASYLSRVTR
ncbi:MAG: hypothetical protein KC766_15220 [Myxococcales bacterium]|nr:hypothetical protein [Myxococcales bacterium]